MTLRTAVVSLVAVLPLAVVAGCGGSEGATPSTGSERGAAEAPPGVLTCPKRTSTRQTITVTNRTGIRLRMATEPRSVTCADWSLTGNPTNVNTEGGQIVAPGDDFAWNLELAQARIGDDLTWTITLDDVPMDVPAGGLSLQYQVFAAMSDHGSLGLLGRSLKVKSSEPGAQWVCGSGRLVPVGTLRGKELFVEATGTDCQGGARPAIALVAR